VNGSPASVREALHARVAGLLEHAFNPIMLKELRASLRGLRFFISHIVILCLFAAGLLLAFLAMMPSRPGGYDDPGDPSAVGRSVYLITQFLQLGVAFLVVPGLAATSISSERESLTHDLLLTTTMSARQIVWGKFTAAMTQAFTIFISMVPLVSLCFLFGGVTVYQILANYAFLFALSTVMIAYALSMSASARTTQRAVGSVYGLTLLGGLALWGLAAVLLRTPWLASVAMAYGFVAPVDAARFGTPLELADRILYVHLVPAYLWVAATSLFFINATNRLKPIFANRSTPLRIYFATVLFSAGALAALLMYHTLPPASPVDDRSYVMMAFAIILLAASLLGALFACEEPFPSRLLENGSAPQTGWRRALGLFHPGSNSGAAFTVITVGLFLLCSFAAFRPFVRGFDRGAWAGSPAALPLAAALLMVFSWTFFTATFARFLGALLPERPMLLRTILVLTCLFLALFPLIHWAIAEAIDRDPFDEAHKHGPFTLALSPVMAILSSLDLRAGRREFPLYAGSARIPVAAAFAVFSLAAGAVFLKLGTRARAKLRKELEAPPETNVSGPAPA
jgi:ABC-type transport system involved in multi-copper enzyme maturation permease subunit